MREREEKVKIREGKWEREKERGIKRKVIGGITF